MHELPDVLSHYYECDIGPFRNLSDLPMDEAEAVLEQIRERGRKFASRSVNDRIPWF